MDKKLLTDCIKFTYDKKMLMESVNDNKPLIVKGVLQRAESKNQNGRIYPKEILMKEATKYEENFIKQNRALGELDHPESSVVNLRNVSHNIKEMHWENNDLVGTVEILSTPSGNILKELFKNEILLGISSRGLGSVKPTSPLSEDDTVMVQDDFELIAFDFVSNPSTHGAFLQPSSINESIQQKLQKNPYLKIEQIIHSILGELK